MWLDHYGTREVQVKIKMDPEDETVSRMYFMPCLYLAYSSYET